MSIDDRINSNNPSDNVCRDLPVAAMSDNEFFEYLAGLHATHDAMDAEALLRFFADTDIKPGLRSVINAAVSLSFHCHLPPKAD